MIAPGFFFYIIRARWHVLWNDGKKWCAEHPPLLLSSLGFRYIYKCHDRDHLFFIIHSAQLYSSSINIRNVNEKWKTKLHLIIRASEDIANNILLLLRWLSHIYFVCPGIVNKSINLCVLILSCWATDGAHQRGAIWAVYYIPRDRHIAALGCIHSPTTLWFVWLCLQESRKTIYTKAF